MRNIYHERTLAELEPFNDSVGEINEALFRFYMGVALVNGHKMLALIAGKNVAEIIANLSGSQKELKDEPFYKMGYHGIIPIFVDASLGVNDILIVCKKGIEKLRITDHLS